MTRLGLQLPNRPLLAGELEQIVALGATDYVDLDLFAARWRTLKDRQPDARIHARVYKRGPLGEPAREADELLDLIGLYGSLVSSWRSRNEPNVESPGLTPAAWRDFLIAFGQECSPEVRGAARLFTPAPSPGVAFSLWWGATADAAADGRYDGMDCHAYGSPDEVAATLAIARDSWARGLLVSEHNFGAGRAYSLSTYAGDLPIVHQVCEADEVEALCLFIWQWDHPDVVLPTTVDVKGTVVEGALRELAQCLNGDRREDSMAGPDYATAIWRPVVNHEPRVGHLPVAVCLHRMQGYLSACFPMFDNPTQAKSAHYGVGKAGKIEQFVSESEAAWASGIWNHPNLSNPFLADAFDDSPPTSSNQILVQIELEDYPAGAMPESQYAALLALVRDIFARQKWPVADANRYIRHSDIDSVTRAQDPGAYLDLIRLRADMAGKPPVAVDLRPEVARAEALAAAMAQLATEMRAKVGA